MATTGSGFESAAAVLVQTIAEHNPTLKQTLASGTASTALRELTTIYQSALVAVKTAQDAKQDKR